MTFLIVYVSDVTFDPVIIIYLVKTIKLIFSQNGSSIAYILHTRRNGETENVFVTELGKYTHSSVLAVKTSFKTVFYYLKEEIPLKLFNKNLFIYQFYRNNCCRLVTGKLVKVFCLYCEIKFNLVYCCAYFLQFTILLS